MIYRASPLTQLEMRGHKKKLILSGHAAVFDRFSAPLFWGREKIRPGAFGGSLKRDDPRAIWNHNSDIILGRKSNGTLDLAEDSEGLAFELYPPDTRLVRDMVIAPIERGDVTGMSFGFQTIESSWDNVDGEEQRTLVVVKLSEISPVTFPAYPATDVAVRHLEAGTAREGYLDLRRRRREVGMMELCLLRHELDILEKTSVH